MKPPAEFIRDEYEGSGKLEGKVALVTGGDSGIGRAAAVHFAREGADVAVMYLDEDEGQESLTIAGDVRDSAFCQAAVEEVIDEFGDLNIVVNNAAAQVVKTDLTDIHDDQWEETFATNIHGYFYLTKAALPHLEGGDTIINTTSVTAFEGHEMLVDYSTTKGAIVAFTRSLSQQLAPEGSASTRSLPGRSGHR
ncbi:short chain dehydrogenase/reductase family oxidoreductase [Natronorubrum bangense JCM 10635]|uniref:Short chain dehydrogenase/reductase family oxidoreductase n=1 Tax=Natronorubrum bangense JCM 10635 TaxID=1227500 RepID=L9WE09_9EURY|nr:SDR family NAD(P)-dependent oxidoreductase [Natronorubrum bangense]ELY46538.1 short chain dehydrogenase/reductase family oxidoreductase [Natronorubrum bangense JCM 10635]